MNAPALSAAFAASKTVLEVRDLQVSARSEHGLVPLVQGLSFSLNLGETLAIAGESGSGKSITSLACMGLLPAPAVRVTGGSITLDGIEITALSATSDSDNCSKTNNRIAVGLMDLLRSVSVNTFVFIFHKLKLKLQKIML